MERAAESLQAMLKIDPNDPRPNNDLGYMWAEAGIRLEEATRMIQVAVDAKPQNGAYLDSLGWVFYKQADFERAVKFLEQASEHINSSGAPVILDHLGDAYWRTGENQAAKQAWQRAMQLLGAKSEGTLAQEDLKVRAELEAKLEQLEQAAPPTIAPLGQGVSAPEAAEQVPPPDPPQLQPAEGGEPAAPAPKTPAQAQQQPPARMPAVQQGAHPEPVPETAD